MRRGGYHGPVLRTCNIKLLYLALFVTVINFFQATTGRADEEVYETSAVHVPYEQPRQPATQKSDNPSRQPGVTRPVPEKVFKLPQLDYDKIQDQDETAGDKRFRTRVGVHRDVSGIPSQYWQLTGNSQDSETWLLVIESPDALSLRPHFSGTPPETYQISIFGEQGPGLSAALDFRRLSNLEMWGPAVSGPYLYIEVVKGADNQPPQLFLDNLSHNYRNIFTYEAAGGLQQKSQAKVGTCHNDAVCYPGYSNASNAVARMVFEDNGGTFVCTGTMLNDQNNSEVNWFLTAEHCINNQTVASTLITYFKYRTASCDNEGSVPSLFNTPSVSGATYHISNDKPGNNIYNQGSDYSLLELFDKPPTSFYRLGWTTTALSSSEAIAGVHHPGGSYQRISFGNQVENLDDYWVVEWNDGVVEGGSSGSPLISQSSKSQVRGQLWGGASSCSNPDDSDLYGKFSSAWNDGLSEYLRSSGNQARPPVPTVSASDETFTDKVRITWNNVTLATSYHIYRCTNTSTGSCSLIATGPHSPYDDINAVTGVTYFYRLKACTSSGCSGYSDYDAGTRKELIPVEPSAPFVSDGSHTDKVVIAWSPVSDATSYEVYRCTSTLTFSCSLITTDSASPYEDTGATAGITYYYRITACSIFGCSFYSDYSPGSRKSVPSNIAQAPYTEGFESVDWTKYWDFNSTGQGRITLAATTVPHSGFFHIEMDSFPGGTNSLNEAILNIDLSGKENVVLQFHHQEYTDEDNLMPDSFTGSHNSDGVAISADGINWYRAQGLTSVDGTTVSDGFSSVYKLFTVDLDPVIAQAGISYTSNFRIKFQQYDNVTRPSDGFSFDDISVTADTAPVSVSGTPPPAASFPFSEDFEALKLDSYWLAYSSNSGRVLVTQENSPGSGDYHLTMDSSVDGVNSLNELILTIDLSNRKKVLLRFSHKEFLDEDSFMPDSFTGSHNSDGVAISADGTTWYKLQGLTDQDGIGDSYKQFTADLDAAIEAAGISYTSTFMIKFQQFDNFTINTDGFAFDDISVVTAEEDDFIQLLILIKKQLGESQGN